MTYADAHSPQLQGSSQSTVLSARGKQTPSTTMDVRSHQGRSYPAVSRDAQELSLARKALLAMRAVIIDLRQQIATLSNQLRRTQYRMIELETRRICVICYEASIDTALVPCGHMCGCYDCLAFPGGHWQGITPCPICRRHVTHVLRIYPQ